MRYLTRRKEIPATTGPPPGRRSSRFLWSLTNETVGLATSALLFLALTRYFDPSTYGRLGAVLAVATIATPFATCGSGWLLLKRAVVTDDIRSVVGTAVSVTLVGAIAVTAALAVVRPVVLPAVDASPFVLILIGQLVFFPAGELAVGTAIATGDLRRAATTRLASSAVRIAGLVAFIAAGPYTLTSWAWYLAVSAAGASLVAHAMMTRPIGGWPPLSIPALSEFRTGLPYAAGTSTEGFLAASDRPLLLRYGYASEAGVYAAGYRLATLGFVPLMALIRASDRSIFDAGAAGLRSGLRRGRAVTVRAIALSAVVSAVLFLSAPVAIELLLGDEYAETAQVIRWLAPLPVIKALQFPVGNVLIASGHQVARLLVTVGATALNLVLNLILIPGGGWEAAAITTLVAETSLAAGLWLFSLRRVSNEQR